MNKSEVYASNQPRIQLEGWSSPAGSKQRSIQGQLLLHTMFDALEKPQAQQPSQHLLRRFRAILNVKCKEGHQEAGPLLSWMLPEGIRRATVRYRKLD